MNCHRFEPLSRRTFLNRSTLGLAGVSLASLLGSNELLAAAPGTNGGGVLAQLHHRPRAKRVIYLFQSGGPSQIETFDHKPLLRERHGEELPPSVIGSQRLTGMSSGQSTLPMAGSQFAFARHGEQGTWVSELLPYTARIVDELCIVNSMYTEAINHDPAITFFQTGSQLPGRPSIGSWLSYGLGSDNENLPNFVVLISKNKGGQPLYARLWGNGFLPSDHQGTQFRSGKEPVLFLNNPAGISQQDRKRQMAYLRQLQQLQLEQVGDPEIEARISQFEMAFRMQTSVPGVMDNSQEPDHVFELYGEEARDPGTYAANCLLARRLVEKGVRFVQLYHQGWDTHGNLPNRLKNQTRETDRASAALVMDLKQRGLLEDTLVVWGGEFGRTTYSQGKLQPNNYGRDHHPRCFSMWMAGGGIKSGLVHGKTDEFSYNIAENPVHVHDFQATLLYLLGIDHERLTFKHQGRRFRLTDVHGHVQHDLIS